MTRDDERAALRFAERVGRREQPPVLASLQDRLSEHWDRVAAEIRRGRDRPRRLASDAFLMELPFAAEAAELQTDYHEAWQDLPKQFPGA